MERFDAVEAIAVKLPEHTLIPFSKIFSSGFAPIDRVVKAEVPHR